MARSALPPLLTTPARAWPAVGLFAAVAWSYWGTAAELARLWAHDPTCSHGYVVVAFAAFLLWQRRTMAATVPACPSAWGLAVLLAAAGARLLGAFYHLVWIEEISLLPALLGVILLFWGWRGFRRAWLPVAFLLFAVPPPGSLGAALSVPLKHAATVASAYLLQVLGFSAVADGNVLLLADHELGVLDACSGLRLLVVFFAEATMLALLVRRPPLHRILLVASAAPIAVAANVLRITLTGVVTQTAGSAWAQKVYHDLAGWFMMLFALALLWSELALLARLFPPARAEAKPRPVPTARATKAPQHAARRRLAAPAEVKT